MANFESFIKIDFLEDSKNEIQLIYLLLTIFCLKNGTNALCNYRDIVRKNVHEQVDRQTEAEIL